MMVRKAVLLTVLILAAPAWASPANDLKNCRSVSEEHARLACYDAAADKALGTPYGAEDAKTEDEPKEIIAHITQVSFDLERRFTLTLDNGQVWHQIDTGKAFLKPGTAVTIRAGIMDSHTLTTESGYGGFKVRRVK